MPSQSAHAEPEVAEPVPEVVLQPREKKKKKVKRQPPYNVILWNDDDHTVAYVVNMLQKLFGHPVEMGRKLASEVDKTGKAIVYTTAKEHAEFKQEQIHAYGKDEIVDECAGSMTATIEPAE